MRRWLIAAGALAGTTVVASAVATPKKDFPCKGCVVVPSAPASSAPAPLLIVLHGDGQSAATALEPWKTAAAKRDVILFAPSVPEKGSWWKWDGDPAWIDAQVDAIEGVDPKRVFVAGWSGGASYLGRRTRDLPKRWAALSIDGGGWAPDDLTCPSRVVPAYFLVGDKNELHDLAKGLRAYWTKCGVDLVWDLVPGANHAGEWTALGKRADTILAWLLDHPLPPSPSPPPPPPPAPAPALAPAPTPAAVRGGRCNCSTPGGDAPAALLALAPALLVQRRRRRTSARPSSRNS